MIRSSYKIAQVWGIPIKVHISHFILFLFLMNNYGMLSGLLLGIGLFSSIVLHELGHSVVAINKGCRVREILLMPMGGAAQMEEVPTRPWDEFLMAVAGPAFSLTLGAVVLAAGNALINRALPAEDTLAWYQSIEVAHVLVTGEFLGILLYAGAIITYLAMINISLVVFNLMPAFPMDGGRVLRAMLTPRLGRLRATFVAARLGKLLALLAGTFAAVHGQWLLVAIAFLIHIAAGKEYQMVAMQESAKQRGGFAPFPPGSWPPREPHPDDDDQVLISPPPYETGPVQKTEIHSDDDHSNPFRRLFGG